MFKTNVGPIDDGTSFAYLRPETAQQTFTNFKNIVDSTSRSLPFGVFQNLHALLVDLWKIRQGQQFPDLLANSR